MSDSDKNTSVFAVLQSSPPAGGSAPIRRRDKWILDIPCWILDIQILSISTHLKIKGTVIYI